MLKQELYAHHSHEGGVCESKGFETMFSKNLRSFECYMVALKISQQHRTDSNSLNCHFP